MTIARPGNPNPEIEAFAVKDCSQIVLSTGRHAHSLREFLAYLREVPVESIYQHFWGSRLAAQFDEPEFQNDFASWVGRSLHDQALSEQLGILDPTSFQHLEDLRAEIVDIIETRLTDNAHLGWAEAERPFSFTRGQVVVFDTHRRLMNPRELAEAVPTLTVGSIFFHFIEGRRRDPIAIDDFRAWLMRFWPEYEDLITDLSRVDPYFGSLTDLRARLSTVFANDTSNS